MSVTTAPALSAFDKAKFEFHEPELRIKDWGYDPISPDNSTILLDTTDFKNKKLIDVYHDMSVPILVFTAKCYQEIEYLTSKFNHQEWAVFLTMKKLDSHRPHFLAFDWFMPGQKASGGDVSVQAEDSIKYYDRLTEKYPYYKEHGVHRFLCHLHSHHSMNLANFSSVDDRQQRSRDDLGFYDAYRFYVVVTCGAGMKASFVSYDPAFIRTNAAVAITWSDPDYIEELTKARKKEIDAIAEKALFKEPVATPAVTTTYVWGGQQKAKADRKFQSYNYNEDYDYDYYGWRQHTGYAAYGRSQILASNEAAAKPAEKPVATITATQAPAKAEDEDPLFIEKAVSERDILVFLDELAEMFKHVNFEDPCKYEGEVEEMFTAVVSELGLGTELDDERGAALWGFCRFFVDSGYCDLEGDDVTVCDTLQLLSNLFVNHKKITAQNRDAVQQFLEENVPHYWHELIMLIGTLQDFIQEDRYYKLLFEELTWFPVRDINGGYAGGENNDEADAEYEAYEGTTVTA